VKEGAYMEWQTKDIELRPKMPDADERHRELKIEYPKLTRRAVRAFSDEVQEVKKPKKIPKTPIFENRDPNIIDVNWRGNKTVRFGLMGDTQLNSNYTQLTHLHNFYDECRRQGIKDVYHTGDIDEGERMRLGHAYECYNQGADAHVVEIVKNYPYREGMKTHFITGNHDASMLKHCGYNIGYSIAKERPDMKYLGQDCAVINLTPNCTLELAHPWDGTAYALSYKLQKRIESMFGGEKPNILAVGHYHKAEYFFYRNVHAFQTGCFQAQTTFMRGKNIAAFMGGWIIEIEVDGEGHIKTIKQQYIPYYVAIKDDYKNWQ
jgi:UDP-2,3-diacylglucosamine pyrophosphatase LpxH